MSKTMCGATRPIAAFSRRIACFAIISSAALSGTVSPPCSNYTEDGEFNRRPKSAPRGQPSHYRVSTLEAGMTQLFPRLCWRYRW